MKHVGRSTAVALLSLGTVACGGGDSSGGAPAPSTGLDAPDRNLALVMTPVYQVGGFDAPDWATFGRVSGLRFDAQGRLYILDSQANQVTLVSPEGAFLNTIGEQGEGPGELSNAMGMAVTRDGRVAISDLGHRGLLIYDDQGQFLQSVTVDIQRFGLPTRAIVAHPTGGVLSGGGATIRMSFGGGGGTVDMGPPTRPVTFFGFGEDAEHRVLYEAWDLPKEAPLDDARVEFTAGGSFNMRMPVQRAFEPGLYTDVLPDGRVVVVDSIGYRVKIVDMDGAVARALERPVEPTPVTEEIEAREKERRLEQMAEGGGLAYTVAFQTEGGNAVTGGEVATESMRRRQTEQLESLIFADVIPVIERMVTDWEGRIWVQRSSGWPGEDGPTDIITVEGGYLGSIPADGLRIPSAFGPGGLIARIERDEFDVPTIIIERLPAELGGATRD